MQLLDVPQLEVFEREALTAISSILREGRRLIIAYSGGKDSTTVLMLALNAARALTEEGVSFPPILITHGDTGIENPVVVGLVRNELAKARAYGAKHGFTVRAEIARPLLNDTWAVSILSGRKIPTFANANTRDCTIMFKVDPMTRLRNRILKEDKKSSGETLPVTLIGTRFEESDGRATRMNERGETAYTPWVKDGAWFMSPIANWDMADVWAYLAKFRDGKKEGFTDAKAIFEMYANATDDNTCAVVGDMATESAKKSRACGARFGCSLCAAVGRDKSLEAMLNRPEYAWLRPLNMIQRFIVDTQNDWNRRNWIGRTIVDGYIAIAPDTYSPAMLAELLRYCLTADANEERASYGLGIPPRFQLVSPEQLLAIDALWSINGIQERPFEAVKIWKEVYVDRKRYYPPELEAAPRCPKPATRYLKVGEDWDSDNPGTFTGYRDPMQEAFGGTGCIGTRVLKNGSKVFDAMQAPSFSFDPEAVELFFQFEVDYVLRNFNASGIYNCTAAALHYTRLGMLATTNGHIQEHLDRIMRRTAWKHRHGLLGTSDPAVLLPKTVSKAEMLADIGNTVPTSGDTSAPDVFAEPRMYQLQLHILDEELKESAW